MWLRLDLPTTCQTSLREEQNVKKDGSCMRLYSAETLNTRDATIHPNKDKRPWQLFHYFQVWG